MPDWLSIVKAYVDTLETAVGAIEGATTLHNKLTAARAALLDQITASRLAELDAANIPADVDTLLARLTALRAGYLDNLSGGAVALAASWTAALATALGNYTALRAGYLDELGAANIPANVDGLTTQVATTVAGRLQEAATTINLNQVAATYDLLTGTSQVVILESLVIQMPVGAAGGALTSISIQTNDATVAVIISSVTGAVSNLTSEAQLAWTGAIRIAVGKKIQLTIAGGATGAAYVCNVNAQYRAVVSGGTLA